MGSMAGVISGVGSRVRDDNLKRWAYEHEAYTEYANLLGKLAEASNDPDMAEKLLAAKFRIMTTPPGGKPSKADLDLHSMMSTAIRNKVEGGALNMQVNMPARPKPPGVTSPGKVDVPGLEKLQQQPEPQEKFGSSSAMIDAPGTGPRASIGQSFSMLPPVGEASSVPQAPIPTMLTPPPLPMISKEPGSSAPNPKSGFPSPGFGPGPKQYSPPMLGNPPKVDEDLPEIEDNTDYSEITGEGTPRFAVLPRRPLRDVYEYTTPTGEHRRFSQPLPYNKEEQAQLAEEQFTRLDRQARATGLSDPADIANYINKNSVAHQPSEWAALGGSGLVIYSQKTGKMLQFKGNIKQATTDLAPQHILYGPDPNNPDKMIEIARNDLKVPGALTNLQEAVARKEKEKGSPLTYAEYVQVADDLREENQYYNRAGDPVTRGGVPQVVSKAAPGSIAQGARDYIANAKTTLGKFNTITDLLKNPDFADITGPLSGRIMKLTVDGLGGEGASPQELRLKAELNTLIEKQVFQEAGKAMTGPERDMVLNANPSVNDSVEKLFYLISVIKRDLYSSAQNRWEALGPDRFQIKPPDPIDDPFDSRTGLLKSTAPATGPGGIAIPPGKSLVINNETGQRGLISTESLKAYPKKYTEVVQ